MENIVDHVDPVRYYPLIGPAQLHHCHWKCTVDFTHTREGKQRGVEIVYIDLDHLHQALARREEIFDRQIRTFLLHPAADRRLPYASGTKVWFKPPLAVAVGAAPWTYSSWVTMGQMADQEPIGVRFSQCLMFLPDIMPERSSSYEDLTYRLHLQSPHEFPATTFYPTFEVPADIDDARVDRFLAYNVIPISFTAEENSASR